MGCLTCRTQTWPGEDHSNAPMERGLHGNQSFARRFSGARNAPRRKFGRHLHRLLHVDVVQLIRITLHAALFFFSCLAAEVDSTQLAAWTLRH